jgi:hypothetical protein
MISMSLSALRGGGVDRFIAFGAFNSDAVRNFAIASSQSPRMEGNLLS